MTSIQDYDDYLNDEGLPWNHLDPPEMGETTETLEPLDLDKAPF